MGGVNIRLSSIKFNWQQQHLCPHPPPIWTKILLCLLNCLQHTVFTFSSKFLSGGNFPHKAGHLAYKLSISSFVRDIALVILELTCCFTNFLFLFHIWMKLLIFMYYFTIRYYIRTFFKWETFGNVFSWHLIFLIILFMLVWLFYLCLVMFKILLSVMYSFY